MKYVSYIKILFLVLIILIAGVYAKNRRNISVKSSAGEKNLLNSVVLIEANRISGSPFVRIKWLDSETRSSIYKVYRHTRPIRDLKSLQKSSLLGEVKHGAQQYLDTLEESGSFYYAVVCSVEGLDKAVFNKGQSYTIDPVKYQYQPKHSKSEYRALKSVITEGANKLYAVSLVEAKRVKESPYVIVKWLDIEATNALYKVYRYNKPIDSISVLLEAELLTTTTPGVQYFQDTLRRTGSFYYAVVCRVSDQDYPVFVLAQTYTTLPIRYTYNSKHFTPEYKRMKPVILKGANRLDSVSLIEAQRIVDSPFVQVKWLDSDNQDAVYKVYRHYKPISSISLLQDAVLAGKVDAGIGMYKDLLTNSGSYYYAVICQIDKVNNPVFTHNQSYTTRPVEILFKPSEETVSGIFAEYDKERKSILLSWKDPLNMDTNVILVFRSGSNITSIADLEEPIAEIAGGKQKYEDQNVKQGEVYYYSCLVQDATGLISIFIPGQNSTYFGTMAVLELDHSLLEDLNEEDSEKYLEIFRTLKKEIEYSRRMTDELKRLLKGDMSKARVRRLIEYQRQRDREILEFTRELRKFLKIEEFPENKREIPEK